MTCWLGLTIVFNHHLPKLRNFVLGQPIVMKKLLQPYHLVTLSPWPVLLSFSRFNLLVRIIYWFKFNNINLLILIIIFIILNLFQWWRDVIRESHFQGFHTIKVIKGIKLGIILFIISEGFFFLRIFWCYMHIFLSPRVEIGINWPPVNINSFNPYRIPLLNTVILLSSGIRITWCHYSLIKFNKKDRILSLFITIFLGFIFSIFQLYEYKNARFTISDSVYGSIFFFYIDWVSWFSCFCRNNFFNN